jgi:hypothetical protein
MPLLPGQATTDIGFILFLLAKTQGDGIDGISLDFNPESLYINLELETRRFSRRSIMAEEE